MKTFKDPAKAFAFLGLDINQLPDVSTWPEHVRARKLAEHILETVIEALIKANTPKGEPVWVADTTNWNQKKWWNYFWNIVKDPNSNSGFGFSRSSTGYDDTITLVGARLYMPTEEMANWMRLNHAELYLAANC